ncbi:MAG: hypothetical protein WDN26_10980 [Chitinophagaceae bacterium]
MRFFVSAIKNFNAAASEFIFSNADASEGCVKKIKHFFPREAGALIRIERQDIVGADHPQQTIASFHVPVQPK